MEHTNMFSSFYANERLDPLSRLRMVLDEHMLNDGKNSTNEFYSGPADQPALPQSMSALLATLSQQQQQETPFSLMNNNSNMMSSTNNHHHHHHYQGDNNNSGSSLRKVKLPFPWKLHQLLEDLAKAGRQDVASWLPDGKAFRIHKPDEFSNRIMRSYFRQTKFTSFIRQLYIYGFAKIESGPGVGGYHHPNFIRENRSLTLELGRNQIEKDRRCKEKKKRKNKKSSSTTKAPKKESSKSSKTETSSREADTVSSASSCGSSSVGGDENNNKDKDTTGMMLSESNKSLSLRELLGSGSATNFIGQDITPLIEQRGLPNEVFSSSAMKNESFSSAGGIDEGFSSSTSLSWSALMGKKNNMTISMQNSAWEDNTMEMPELDLEPRTIEEMTVPTVLATHTPCVLG